MARLTLTEILENLPAVLRTADASAVPAPAQVPPELTGRTFTGVSTDTRTLQPGDLFVALSGANFDGHAFIATAIERGAAGVVCRHWPESMPPQPLTADGQPLAVLLAENPLAIYQGCATLYRRTLTAPVIAITGSVGKTSTRGVVAACLAGRLKVHQTRANLNNEIGLPQTLLATPADAEAVVVEMGMRAAGEIRVLTQIARPDIAVITNIGHSHIEFLGSQTGILQAKLEIVEGLAPGGLLVLNGDDPLLRLAGRELIARSGCRVAFVSVSDDLDEPGAAFCLTASGIVPSTMGVLFQARLKDGSGQLLATTEVDIPAPGLHQVGNALLGLACAYAAGLSLADGAEGAARYQNTGSRQRILRIDTLTVMDDSYNASPESMEAAMHTLQTLAAATGSRLIAALGGMLELGPYTIEGHERVGRAAAAAGFAALFVTGEQAEDVARGAHSQVPMLPVTVCSDVDELIANMIPAIHDHDFILVKGSRGFRMEQVVAALEAAAAERGLTGAVEEANPCRIPPRQA